MIDKEDDEYCQEYVCRKGNKVCPRCRGYGEIEVRDPDPDGGSTPYIKMCHVCKGKGELKIPTCKCGNELYTIVYDKNEHRLTWRTEYRTVGKYCPKCKKIEK